MLSNNQKKNKYYINRSRLARKFEQNQQNKEDKIVFFSTKKKKKKNQYQIIFFLEKTWIFAIENLNRNLNNADDDDAAADTANTISWKPL